MMQPHYATQHPDVETRVPAASSSGYRQRPDQAMTHAAQHWVLDPEISYLNHGSFGACPRPVLAAQTALRDRLEREPVAFFTREYEGLLDGARARLAALLGADADSIAFVTNATAGVNTVLASLELRPGDRLVTTDHGYNACRNALDHFARRAGAEVVVATLPFPLRGAEEVVDAVLDCVDSRTRLVLLDHITSPTGLVLPVEEILASLHRDGIDCLVDGAHAPGQVALDLDRLAPAYYTGNCHKWLCTPKGAAFLHVREDRRSRLHPLTISHGANSPRRDRSRFRLEFDWPGTLDPTPWLCIPAALDFLGGLLPGGIEALQRRNRELALAARQLLCDALEVPPPAPADMIACLAAVPLPDALETPAIDGGMLPGGIDPLQETLFREDAIEVPVMRWPAPPRRLIRISAQAYNDAAQYEGLAHALRRHLGPT